MRNPTDKKPNWECGLVGLALDEMDNLPPQVYGAPCKLRDMEHPDLDPDGTSKKGGEFGWLRKRFTTVI